MYFCKSAYCIMKVYEFLKERKYSEFSTKTKQNKKVSKKNFLQNFRILKKQKKQTHLEFSKECFF